MPQPIEVIINGGSGSVEAEETKRELTELFKENGVEANIHLAQDGGEIVELAKKLAKSEAEIIVAGGGDGTISAVAEEVLKAGKILGVLPLGTLNNFSKDLQISQEIEEAVLIIAERRVQTIDVGEVNGQIFVNNSSIGLYPHIVKRREAQQRLGHGKWRSAFWAAVRLLKRSPFFAVRLETDKGTRVVKTPFVFVGNNEYEMDFFNIGRRAKMDDGKLSIYFLHRSGRKGLFLLVLRTIFGRLRQTKDFEEIVAEEITIETRKKQVLVAFDGEVEKLETPLRYKIHKQALRVIVPKEN
ncbi:MAG TPA: diacylglycerol kinase family protein [Pyrinomonadaceae bacterium]|jgi:diacylglycerol kinase family enzyme|nr:diacylglycerol kinase family protein [Pyrinomonadaceae bacterium]